MTHERIRHDRIDESGVITLRHAGRLHHIGIGRTHARTHVIMLVQDLHIRVVHAATGQLLREVPRRRPASCRTLFARRSTMRHADSAAVLRRLSQLARHA